MISYQQYDLSLTSEGSELIDLGFMYLGMTIEEMVGGFPTIKIYLDHPLRSKSDDLDELELSLQIENYKVETTISRVKIVQETERIVFWGKAINKDALHTRQSDYLGSDLESAIQALDLRDTIEGVSPIPGDYFMINETKEDAFLRLIKGAKEETLPIISLDSLVIADLNSPSGIEDFLPPDSMKEVKITDIHRTEWDYKENTEGIFQTFSWADKFYIAMDNVDFAYNYVMNMRNENPPYFIMIGTYSIRFPYDVGAYMDNQFDNYAHREFQIVGKITQFSINDIRTRVLFSAKGE